MENTKQSLWSKDFIIIVIINLLLFLSWQMLLPTLPLYAKSLGGSDALLGWLLGSTTIASLIIRPFSGILIDSIGRKTILLPGLLVLMLITFSFPWLNSVGALIAIRFFHGIGWGMASTASSTIASDNIPTSHFGEGMGYFSLSSSLAMAIAPGIALAIFSSKGFNLVSYLASGLIVIVLALTFLIRSSKVVKVKNKYGKLTLYEKSSILPSVVMFFVSSTYGSITGFLSLYATTVGISNVGGFFTIYAITLLISRPILGKLTDRYGFNATVYPGLVLVLSTMFTLYKATSITMFLFSALLYGLGLGAVQSSLQTMAITRAPKDRIGAANATFYTGFDGGIGFGSVIGGVIASYLGYSQMYLSFLIFPILAAIIYYIFFIKNTKKA